MVAKLSNERMTPGQVDAGTDEAEARSEKRRRLNALAEKLLSKRDEAVLFRSSSGVEKRWREDEATFDASITDASHQSSMIDYATGAASPRSTSGPIRSRVVVNVLRPKCETAEGRFSDILLPVDDRNWGLKVTPVPELVKGMKDDRQPVDTSTGQLMVTSEGQPVKTSDIARAKMDKAKEAMTGMESEIDDQLTECGFNGECRNVTRDAIRAGTGVLKGPNVIKQVKKAWVPKTDGDRTVHVLEIHEDPQPESKRVDYWNVYPDPHCGENIKRAAYIWEYDEILPRELRRRLSGWWG